MKVVCISGKAHSGKDTLAGMMVSELEKANMKVATIHYADLLKFFCSTYLGWNGEKDHDGRQMLQRVGTDVFRNHVDTDYWVDCVLGLLRAFAYMGYDLVIIPDCRFENEIKKPADLFDVVHIRIIRPSSENNALIDEDLAKHVSENALNDTEPDIVVYNSGDLNDLLFRAREVTVPLVVTVWTQQYLEQGGMYV